MKTLREQWRTIPGWPYEVSDAGRVRNVNTGRIIRPYPAGYNNLYRAVDLWRDQERRKVKVHRLVAEAFLPPPMEGQDQVNHWDTDPTNNRASNLEWATQAENTAHRDFWMADRLLRA